MKSECFPVDYSTLSASALLNTVVSNYDLPLATSIAFLKRGFNDTYLINTGIKKYILRVYKYQWRSLASIETELKLINTLNANGVGVSYPIETAGTKQFILSLNAPEGIRYAVLFSFAEGVNIKKLSIQQAHVLGQEVGKIHRLTHNQSFGETAHHYDIEEQFNKAIATLEPVLKDYPEQFTYITNLRTEFIKRFNSLDKKELKTGICHGDLQSENYHVSEDGKLTFFDFDFFGNGYLAYDIGVFVWYDHKNKSPQIIQSFLDGYQLHCTLSETEKKLIPYFSTIRALFQMRLYCDLNNGHKMPLWPAKEVATFIDKVKKWQERR
ncbi:MAG: phosphotransferase [Bacteroidia bacterium]